MLGRGALASPTLARAAAWELGIRGAPPTQVFRKTPAEWLPFVRRFVEISFAMAHSASCIAARTKQWLRIANHDGRMSWFNALKTRKSPQELLAHLTTLMASGVGEDALCVHRRRMLEESCATSCGQSSVPHAGRPQGTRR
jgi:hypothetical protein